MSEQLVKEELYLQIMDGLEKSCRLMAAYDEMPHEYGDSILYQVESYTIERIGIAPGITSSELSAGMNKTPSASSQIIRKLRKKGLVFQKRNKDNNREYNLFLTDYGWRIYKAHAAVDEECGRRKLKQLSVFSEEELRTYLKIHNVINEGFEADVRQAGKISDALSKSGVSCGAGVEKVEIIVKLKYEERAAVVNLWQLFL